MFIRQARNQLFLVSVSTWNLLHLLCLHRWKYEVHRWSFHKNWQWCSVVYVDYFIANNSPKLGKFEALNHNIILYKLIHWSQNCNLKSLKFFIIWMIWSQGTETEMHILLTEQNQIAVKWSNGDKKTSQPKRLFLIH